MRFVRTSCIWELGDSEGFYGPEPCPSLAPKYEFCLFRLAILPAIVPTSVICRGLDRPRLTVSLLIKSYGDRAYDVVAPVGRDADLKKLLICNVKDECRQLSFAGHLQS
jgi:hypothetical protein